MFDDYLAEIEEEKRAQRREVWMGMLEAALAFWPVMLLLVFGYRYAPLIEAFFAAGGVSHG